MAVSNVAAGDQDPVGPLKKGLQEKSGLDPPGAHDPKETDLRRVGDPGNAGQIGPGVGAPMADKGEDEWFMLFRHVRFGFFFFQKGPPHRPEVLNSRIMANN